jgi:hypothetical protein
MFVMAAGWGIRGSYGHSRGAMMPGAMLGLALAVCSNRPDWWRRSAIIGFLCAIGWGFGGASSYGRLIHYSLDSQWSTSFYGYWCLFLVGALYSGIGGACLALAITAPRSFLESAVGPLVLTYSMWLMLQWLGVEQWSLDLFAKDPALPEQTAWLYDTRWLCAVSSLLLSALLWIFIPSWRGPLQLMLLLSAAWLASMAILIGFLGFRINPSRSDAWAGCLGIQIAFLAYYYQQRNRAALLLCAYGILSGGIGFVVGQFVQALGRARYGIIGRYPVLQEFGYWTIMEQVFGAAMGLGMGLAVCRLLRGGLTPTLEDVRSKKLNCLALFSLFGVIPVLNMNTNVQAWHKAELIPRRVLGLDTGWVLLAIAVVWLLLWLDFLRIYRRGRLDLMPESSLGRARGLAVGMSLLVLTLYAMLPSKGLPTSLFFVASLAVANWLLLQLKPEPIHALVEEGTTPESSKWRLTWGYALWWVIALWMVLIVSYATTQLDIPR